MFRKKNIKQTYVVITQKVKDFLLSAKSREFFVFLFFFFVAGGFWLLQTLNNDYETEFSVPVRLKNVPDNVMITSEPPSSLRIKVRDRGTVLLNYMLGKSFYPVTLEYTDYQSTNNHVRIYPSQLSKKLQGQLKASTQLLAMYPDTLDYIYATGVSKKVKVKMNGKLSAARHYYLSDTIFYPDSVLVYAPQVLLDTIQSAVIQYVNFEDLSDTLHMKVSLEKQKGVKFVPSTVELELPIDIYTEKTVEVPVEGVGFPIDKVLRAFPSKVKVTFQIGMGYFRQVDASDFSISVPYEELLRLGSDKYKVKLNACPDGISHIRFSPEQIDFLIEQTTPQNGN